ncbi:MAG: ABC transporter permease, partial [Amphiplicatus sp.]
MTALLDLHDVRRYYGAGDTEVRALDGVSLSIEAGEFVAIVGQSGSGKSTLMNILGCLDRPTGGVYKVRGVDVAGLDADALAALRRDTFGFVFQRYNLLATATALENVEIPAIYAGLPLEARAARAGELLAKLGLGDRTSHRPGELSGGQQQRVSIARALMNDAEVILADEPTGALDSGSSAELLTLLEEMHAGGRTIILITHDHDVAARAHRTIEIKDGRIVSDSGVRKADIGREPYKHHGHAPTALTQVSESVKMALRSLRANLFRTALTLLGVIIGVAAVVVMLAIGEGSSKQVVASIETMGSNLLFVRPGAPGTRMRGSAIATLTIEDANAVAELGNIIAAVPEREGRETLRVGSLDYSTRVSGVSADWPKAQKWEMGKGAFFTADDQRRYATTVVLGETVASNLFPNGENPVGDYVFIGGAPFEVAGVLSARGATAWGQDMD